MSAAPISTPGAIVTWLGDGAAIWLPAFDVGKVEQNFSVLAHILADAVIVAVEHVGVPAVGMPGHVDEADMGVVLLQLFHGSQVLVNGGGVVGELPTPGPHEDVDICVGRVIQVVVRRVDEIVGIPTPAIIVGQAQSGAFGLRQATPIPNEAVAVFIHVGAQIIHAGFHLTAMGRVAIEQHNRLAGSSQPGIRNAARVGGGVVNDDCAVRLRGKRGAVGGGQGRLRRWMDLLGLGGLLNLGLCLWFVGGRLVGFGGRVAASQAERYKESNHKPDKMPVFGFHSILLETKHDIYCILRVANGGAG